MNRPKIVGIVNITSDSFSDGGKFLSPDKAIAHARQLVANDADIIELSGASSNPHSAPVPPEVEIKRMQPVLDALDCPVSIDATKPEVLRWAMSKRVAYLNDIRGFPDEPLYAELAASDAKLVVMHMMSDTDRANRAKHGVAEVFNSIHSFFEKRLRSLEAAGVSRKRLIVDPGMGFFLSSDPEPSFAALNAIPELRKRFGLPVMISVSRKSFLRGGAAPDSPQTATRTLVLEVSAAERGVDYIRTHEVRGLRQALGA